MNTWVNLFAAAVVAAVSGTGGWATLQFILNRRGRKAEAARVEAEAETKRTETKRLRQDMAQAAQDAAVKTWSGTVERLEHDLSSCRGDLTTESVAHRHTRDALESLIDAFEAYIEQEDVRAARVSIRAARAVI